MNLCDQKLVCQLCFMQFKGASGLQTHLRRKHSLYLTSYKEMFSQIYVKILSQQQLQRKQSRINRDEQAREEGLQELVCQICGFTSMLSLSGHIVKIHKLKRGEYKQMFPGTRVGNIMKQQREKASRTFKEKYKNDPIFKARLDAHREPFPHQIEHWTKRGFSVDEAKIKTCEFQKMASLISANSESAQMKRSMSSSGNNNPMSLFSISKRYNVSIEEAKKLTPCFGRTGDVHPMFGKQHTQESLRKIASSHHLKNPSQRSKNEIEIAEFVSSLCDDVVLNHGFGRWNIDIFCSEKRTAIEHFGCMWHAHHCMNWTADTIHPLYGTPVSVILDRNTRKESEISASGIKLVIVWECEWHSEKELQVQRIRNAFNR